MEFAPSPSHWATLDNGQPAVAHYDLEVYRLGTASAVVTLDMGKPSPDADGKIRYDISSQASSWPLEPVQYEARVSAVGPEGTGRSAPSNPFTFTSNTMCAAGVSPTALSASAAGGSHAVNVSTDSGCGWAASSSLAWVTVPASGTGSATVPVTVQANSSSSGRTGTITIAGQNVSVSQDGAPPPCSYTVTPTSVSAPATGGSYGVSVSTGSGCGWAATSGFAWVTVPASGTGSATVPVTVQANSSTSRRTGMVTIAGQDVGIAQDGAPPPCTYTVTPTSASAPATGGSYSVDVTTGTACAWTVASNQSWVVPAVTQGTGSARVAFTVKATTQTKSRTATLTVATKAVTVTEAGKPRKR